MWHLHGTNLHSANTLDARTWAPCAEEEEVPHDKTPQAVLWDMGRILAIAASFALTANLALLAFHIA
jgi:hypothetical protein